MTRANSASSSRPIVCGHCGWGHHRLCGTLRSDPNTCACADTGHQPRGDLARQIARYRRPDIDGGPDLDTLTARVEAGQ